MNHYCRIATIWWRSSKRWGQGERNCVANRRSVVDGADAFSRYRWGEGLLFENVLMVLLKPVLPAAHRQPASGRGYGRWAP